MYNFPLENISVASVIVTLAIKVRFSCQKSNKEEDKRSVEFPLRWKLMRLVRSENENQLLSLRRATRAEFDTFYSYKWFSVISSTRRFILNFEPTREKKERKKERDRIIESLERDKFFIGVGDGIKKKKKEAEFAWNSPLPHVHFPIRHMAIDKNHMLVYSHEHRSEQVQRPTCAAMRIEDFNFDLYSQICRSQFILLSFFYRLLYFCFF